MRNEEKALNMKDQQFSSFLFPYSLFLITYVS